MHNRQFRHISRKSALALFCLLISSSLPACYDQETVERVVTLPNADSYSINIYFLSEFAGRLLPQKNNGEFYLCNKSDDENTWYYKKDKKLKPEYYASSTGELPFVLQYTIPNTDKTIKFTPITGQKLAPDAMPEKSWVRQSHAEAEYANCYVVNYEYYTSGITEMYETWLAMGFNDQKDIVIGNGDNYGVSTP